MRVNLKSMKLLWDNWSTEERIHWLSYVGVRSKDVFRCSLLEWNRLYWAMKCKLVREISYESANLIQPMQLQTAGETAGEQL